jgi:serine-type D-Ala-D-Ala carboxypeptidase/endopeptidase (penicillin-binding protein 4)
MKLYTVAAALDRLSPDYRFVTSVYAPTKPDAKGVVHGDLTIYGRGDPSIAARFNEGNYFKALEDLSARIVAAGVKRVDGDLVGDESYFTGPPYGAGWEWEDLQWWYGAEVSALTLNDNYLDTIVKPGNKVGVPAVITTGPPDPLLRVNNRVTTAANGTRRDLSVYRPLGSDAVEFSGSIALDDKGYSGRLAISRPALLFAYLLRASLAQQGVTIKGKTRTIDSYSGDSLVSTGALALVSNSTMDRKPLVEIARKESVPFSMIAAQTLKPSQNLYTELILRTLGETEWSRRAPGELSAPAPSPEPNRPRTSEGRGIEAVRTFLKEASVEPSSLSLTDGSGLSRNDMITAEATLQLLTYMHRHRYANAFREALPIAGIDGTLRNRMKGTAAENNLRAKTGTLSAASSLSGFVTSASGERLVFSIMVNNYPESTDAPSVCIDPIAILLASFAGKSEARP